MAIDANQPFDLRGGSPALDFVNTAPRLPGETEKLATYADLLRFCAAVSAVDKATAGRLTAEGSRHPRLAADALASAIALREALYGLVLASVEGRRADPALVTVIDGWISSALSARRLKPSADGGYELALQASNDLLSILHPVALAAADLLTSRLDRLRLCEEHEVGKCAWLFLDDTKNGSRKFCSMEECGNRAKQRRFQARQR